jgi:hypothetical protein
MGVTLWLSHYEEYGVRPNENAVARITFGPKMEEVTGN